MSHVLVAPDKFKGTLTAAEAAARIAAGLRRASPDLLIRLLPVADGGEGTVEAAVAAGFRPRRAVVTGPLGRPVTADYAVRGDTAVVELAQAAGLHLVPADRRDPLTATTRGVGELLRLAVRSGARRIVLAVGGSATTDGGAGMLQALGVRLLDARGRDVPPGGAALAALDRVDPGGVADLLDGVEVVLAADVDNPLLGPEGAAAVYGPQKGASPEDVRRLEGALSHFADLLGAALGRDERGSPGAGAAGGAGFAALACLGARRRGGIGYLLELLGFADHLVGARLVVTGEGGLDEQTLRGKAPAGVLAAARAAGVPAAVVAGVNRLTPERLRAVGFASVHTLHELEPDPARCLAEAGPLLEELAVRLARHHGLDRDRPATTGTGAGDRGAAPEG